MMVFIGKPQIVQLLPLARILGQAIGKVQYVLYVSCITTHNRLVIMIYYWMLVYYYGNTAHNIINILSHVISLTYDIMNTIRAMPSLPH